MTLSYSTVGESHGAGLGAIVSGLPAGLTLPTDDANELLARRQQGFGRGARMKLEQDQVEVRSGIRRGKTLGSPVLLWVANKDQSIDTLKTFTQPRPGHVDLPAIIQHQMADAAAFLERSSARETAARVAAGGIAAGILRQLGVDVLAEVTGIGASRVPHDMLAPVDTLDAMAAARAARNASEFHAYSAPADMQAAWHEDVESTKRAGDTLGGTVRVVATGVPAGLGSAGDRRDRFDARLAFECMAIPSVKGVEIGLGFDAAARHGSKVHDPILPGGTRGWVRPTNHAGGIEGGLTNGEPVCVTLAFKPIPTLRERLATVDAATGEAAPAGIVRSDVCAVPRAAIVAEAVVAFEVLAVLLERAGAPVWSEVRANVSAWRARGRLPVPSSDWAE